MSPADQDSPAAEPPASIAGCRIIELPTVHDRRGNLTFIEAERHIPFALERVYYVYDVPGGSTRAGHAHRTLNQFLVAVSGSFDVIVKDGSAERRFTLNRGFAGLHIPPMIWRELENFSSGAVCLALASAHYDESDYIYEYDEYLDATAGSG